jgi:phosphotransferase system enzyme I (PtsI)
LDVVDFVSIGSNDLVQYLMAADRDNPKVSHLCQPLSPPVIRLLTDTIRTCRRADKPVTLCGEMAGSPRAFVLLLGMGLRSFSMSPAFIPTIKDLASHVSCAQAAEILHKALALKTTSQIKRFLRDRVAKLAPNLKMLDTW